MEPAEKCPHCGKETLAATTETITDTAGVEVRVWACAECGYTEGRPVPPVAPAEG